MLVVAMGRVPYSRWALRRQVGTSGICLLAAVVWTAAAAAAASFDGAQQARADRVLDRLVASRASPNLIPPFAASVSAGCNSQLLYSGARGEARPGVPATSQTLYRIGSISKQFVATAVIAAMAQGALKDRAGVPANFDTRVSGILPEAAPWDEDADAPLTIRSLLTMTSNLPNFTRRPPAELDPWGAVEAKTLLAALSRLRRRETTGSFEYSNTGYFLLSEILREGGAESSYESAVRRYVIERAQLKATGFAGDAGMAQALAKPHYRRKPAFIVSSWLQGSADMVSSAEDLFAWNSALMEERVLPRRSLDVMFADAARVDVWTYYGMGWFVTHKDGRDTYFHSGTVPGYTGFSAISRQPDGRWCAVAILTSSDGIEGLDEFADAFMDIAEGAQD
jgi:CubicO group peptidase (beta-lactamase class C family)